MTALDAVRRFALVDLVVTALLAIPWLSEIVLSLLLTWFGLDGSPADVELSAVTMVFVNLAGVLGVLWNGRRWRAPTTDLVRWDMWGRVAVAVVFVSYLLAADVPSVLWLFVGTELAGALAARQHLRPAVS